jgi:hypothetical protein
MPESTTSSPSSPLLAAMELLVLFCLFLACAGGPPPEVNEAHYLAKARHAWDPAWCSRDIFLQSADAHAVFFAAFGWVTLVTSLPAAAWIGRVLSWLLLAIAWRRLSNSITTARLSCILTAAWFILLSEYFRMAGEWVLGGVEAKSFAYPLVFLGLAAVIESRWRECWLWLGLAISFHPVVGGWALLATLGCWIWERDQRPALSAMYLSMMLGALLALPGIIPALSVSLGPGSKTDMNVADQVLVYRRLGHHLAIHQFPWTFIARHVALGLAWIFLSCWLVRGDERLRRLQHFVLMAVFVAICGAIIDQSLLSRLDWAARLLKFYWYRLSDALLPLGMALMLPVLVSRLQQQRHERPAHMLLFVLMLIPAVVLGVTFRPRLSELAPRSDRRWDAWASSPEAADRIAANWIATCRWIERSTPEQALFLTPRPQQTFKWYAERAEVVNWKDIPQDAEHILEWWRRTNAVFPWRVVRQGLTVHSDDRLLELAAQYEVEYVVVERFRMTRPLGPRFRQVYPTLAEQNPDFAVFSIHR